MARVFKLLAVILLVVLLVGCMPTQSPKPDLTTLDVINNVEGDLIIRRAADHIWIYTAYQDELSKNGLILESDHGIGIIDPPDNLDQAERLDALIEEYFGKRVDQVLWTGRLLTRQPVYQHYQEASALLYVPEAVAQDESLEGAKLYIPNAPDKIILEDHALEALCFRKKGDLEALHISLWLEELALLYTGPNLISQDIDMIESPVYETSVWEQIVTGLQAAVPNPVIVVTDSGAAGGPELFDHTFALIREREFTLNYGSEKLPLRKVFLDEEITKTFGKPEKIEESILGIGADTFTGSRIRTFSFNKTQVSLFAPPNGQDFWLSSIVTRDPRFSTVRGLNVGESLELLITKYPEAKPVPNEMTDPGNMDYVYDQDTQGEYAICFEVRAGIIDRIRLEYTLR
ncbi:MBL fold metallo-hydrolase [Acidaminobacter hydrogenoformans]|uniref:Uncharacterized protein n=1 Tax=Acidaminobacter hydrogenoformans DSM 2784 TaxID=1120920 RepID=A0A1G5RZK5_9FIRM|nr:hypothetical protein [Acidaminobacter hydrogenoformans]SCZ78891.1 hypothetical protein SAMN03080599_01493 [Acidaminobacter hydrogenoformans DSM 2784]